MKIQLKKEFFKYTMDDLITMQNDLKSILRWFEDTDPDDAISLKVLYNLIEIQARHYTSHEGSNDE